MSLPSEGAVQHMLMRLIGTRADNAIQSQDAYRLLEPKFFQLTADETRFRYQNSSSKFANRVQWAVKDLKEQGLLLHDSLVGRGVWKFSEYAEKNWQTLYPSADDLLREMRASD